MGDQKLYFKVKNNTNDYQEVSLFSVADMFTDGNGKTSYSWDMTAELASSGVYNFEEVILLSAPASSDVYEINVATIAPAVFSNVTQILNALNTLGLGTFTNPSGNIILLESADQSIVFSSLSLGKTALANYSVTISDLGLAGSLIFNAGYTDKLIGTFSRINTGNPFWINTTGEYDGRYNACVINSNAVNYPQNMFANVVLPGSVSKIVYVGLSFSIPQYDFNNPQFIQLFINSSKIIDITALADLNALAAQTNSQLGTAITGNEMPYSFWMIFPVTLNPGENLFQAYLPASTGVYARNIMGFQVYDNTKAELEAATSTGDLNILYSSIEFAGQFFF